MNLNPESAAAITPKLNEALRSLADQVKRVFYALQTYAQPFVLNQRNKIIAKAKGVQDRYAPPYHSFACACVFVSMSCLCVSMPH